MAPVSKSSAPANQTPEERKVEAATDPQKPETANVGTATNPPSASETLPEGTPVDPTSGPQGAPSPHTTGFHCGYCGQPVGREGEHFNAEGEAAAAPHANTMVVADDWANRQVKDAE